MTCRDNIKNMEADWKWLRKYTAIRQVPEYCFELGLPGMVWIHLVQPVSLIDSVLEDALAEQYSECLPPDQVDGEEEDYVSRVGDSQVYSSQLQYLIQWIGSNSLLWEHTKFVG